MRASVRFVPLAVLLIFAAGGAWAQGSCELSCYGEQSQCAWEYCGWNYDWYWCNIGCDQILGQCLQDCEDFGGPPTCSVGIIDTWTTTEVLNEFGAFTACSGTPGTNGRFARRVTQSLEIETWNRWQWADCTTSLQLVSRTFENRLCERVLNFFCGQGGGTVPACID